MRCHCLIASILFLLIAGVAAAQTVVVNGFTALAIQQAVDQAAPGGTVFLPAGNYLMDRTVNIPHAGLTLRGAGTLENVGRTEPAPPYTPPVWSGGVSRCYTNNIDLLFFRVQADDVVFRDLKLEGIITHTAGIGEGINVTSRHRLLVEGCEITRFRRGIQLDNSRQNLIRGNFIHSNYRNGYGYGISIVGPSMTVGGSHAVIRNNEFAYNRHCIASNGPETRFVVENNFFRDNDQSQRQASVDMHAQGGSTIRCVVRNNYFSNQRPIEIKSGSMEVTGNVFDDTCSSQTWRMIGFNAPVHNGSFVPQSCINNVFVSGNIDLSMQWLVYASVYNYPPEKWIGYNLFYNGMLWEDVQTTYPPLSTDPRPLVGWMHLTDPVTGARVDQIRVDEWYDLNIEAADPQGWSDIAEIGVQIIDNDTYNFIPAPGTGSHDPQGRFFLRLRPDLVEARLVAGSDAWTPITGQLVDWVDARPGTFAWNQFGTHHVQVRVRVRLGLQARIGDNWRLHGFAIDKNGNLPVVAWHEEQEGWPLGVRSSLNNSVGGGWMLYD